MKIHYTLSLDQVIEMNFEVARGSGRIRRVLYGRYWWLLPVPFALLGFLYSIYTIDFHTGEGSHVIIRSLQIITAFGHFVIIGSIGLSLLFACRYTFKSNVVSRLKKQSSWPMSCTIEVNEEFLGITDPVREVRYKRSSIKGLMVADSFFMLIGNSGILETIPRMAGDVSIDKEIDNIWAGAIPIKNLY